ncbi:MAG: folylpolyglutamate synthase/dihydrofolate synthase family protein [Hyphomonadaceae bacterium]|nr:folylpolyglutamate synthase/dihydrofolate synthase family protein [Hyphomonadaceae bacterium]
MPADALIVENELNRFRDAPGRVSPAFGTTHIRKALVELGDPQDRIPRAIHLTGTNGKGSTGAFIRAMAEAAGLKVHVFTSPHLLRINERIRIASELVSDDELAEVLAHIAKRTQGLTYFEALTAAAFCLFAHHRADISIIEVGAGGATDATNVMHQPAATVVTPISLDHEAMFGLKGVAAIARLKAGIFREGVPAVLADQPAIALGVLREEARAAAAPVTWAGHDWTSRWNGQAFIYESKTLTIRAPWLGLPGQHQAQNAGAACAVLEAMDEYRVKPEAMSAGLREAAWPARLQRLKPGPLAPENGPPVWIDAAHNPGGAEVLADAIRALAPEEGDKVALIFAIQEAKDAESVLKQLVPVSAEVIVCPLPDSGGQEGGPGADPQRLAGIVDALGGKGNVASGFADAITQARDRGADRIYVCGSVYLCGAVLAANGESVT